MARGIITNNGTGGGPPKMVVTDFDVSRRANYKPGDELECISQFPLQLGFLVEGTVDINSYKPVVTVNLVVDSSPTVVANSLGGNVNIEANKAYLVQTGGQLTGNVSVNGGVLLVNGGKATGNVSIAANSTIIANNGSTIGGGTFDVTGTGTNAVIVFKNTTVNGKFSTSGITFVDLGGNTFNGNVSSSQDQYVTIKNNTIGNNKNLSVSQVVVECDIANNTVSGSVTIDPQCQV